MESWTLKQVGAYPLAPRRSRCCNARPPGWGVERSNIEAMGNDIKPVEKPLSGRIATSLAAAVPAGGISYMSGRIFAKWGVLDAPADWIGEYLRVHVPPGTAGWVLGFLIFVILYGLILWKVWRPRHIHHLPVPHETAPVATSTREFIPAPPPPSPAGIGSKAAAGSARTTIWDRLEDRTRGSFLRYLLPPSTERTWTVQWIGRRKRRDWVL